jgi:hypothetical protein
MLTLAQMEAKAKKGSTKKRADDNHVTSGRVPLSNMNNGGKLKRVKVEKEVKVNRGGVDTLGVIFLHIIESCLVE